jgi:HNH endonuclease
MIATAVPDGLLVCHTCDNPPCVLPDHLFIGTDADNNADRLSKGRYDSIAKLTEADVREIRSRYAAGGVTQRALAEEFGVIHQTIHSIIRRKNWKHIE